MSKGKRLSILTKAEVDDLYSPPVLSVSDQRFFFAFNDRGDRIRDRKQRVAWQSINLKGVYFFGQAAKHQILSI